MWRNPVLTRPIVFAGPSLARLSPDVREQVELRPPARRGELAALLQRPPGRAVLIDGLFGQAMAVTPTECRQLLTAGWSLWGASSMGALRASELWSVGMIGVGEVYGMLRADVVVADDEVAVAYHPDTHQELTASLVHVRALLRHAERKGLPHEQAMEAFSVARRLYWLERSWARVFQAWKTEGLPPVVIEQVKGICQEPDYHPKVRDAEAVVQLATAELWP